MYCVLTEGYKNTTLVFYLNLKKDMVSRYQNKIVVFGARNRILWL